MNKFNSPAVVTREKLQSEKDEKKKLMAWGQKQQSNPLLKKYYEDPDILFEECNDISIDGKYGQILRKYKNYVSEHASINETVEDYIENMIFEPFCRDYYEGTLLNIYTKDDEEHPDKPIDFLAINIFDTVYIVETQKLQLRSYDAIYTYFYKLMHKAIELHAYSTMSLSNMVKVKEKYPNIKNYSFDDENGTNTEQKIVDLFQQTYTFDLATYMSLLRNVESGLFRHIDETYKPEVKKDLYKVLLLGFLFTYYNKEYYFLKEGVNRTMEDRILRTFNYKITGIVEDAVYSIDNIIEALYKGKGGRANYCGEIYGNCVFRYLGKIGANMNKMNRPSINDIIHTISVDMQDKPEHSADMRNVHF